MDIFLLRTAEKSKLADYFTPSEIGALRFFMRGENRTAEMFDFAARCYAAEPPTLRHPLGYGKALCTHSNSLKNTYNTLHFSLGPIEEFIVVQRVTFMDALIFPKRGVALIIRSIKEEQVAGVIEALERIKTKHPKPRAFAGFVVSHHRPYHYFYESLPAIMWFDRKVRSTDTSAAELVQLEGGDYFPANTLFPQMPTSTVNSSALNWTSKIADVFYVKLGFSGMWDKDQTQVDAINLLDGELRDMFLSSGTYAGADRSRRPGVLFDVSDAKGTWETIADDIPIIVGQLIDRLGTGIDVYLDGWTLASTPTPKELKTARSEATLARSIGRALPEGATHRSLVGASPFTKMQFMNNVDVAVSRYSTGSMIPSRVMHKPGIVHHSGQAGIFQKLHFHGPKVHELTGKAVPAEVELRDQDISYSLDSELVSQILGDLLAEMVDVPG